MSNVNTATTGTSDSPGWLGPAIGAAAIGAAISVSLGVYGRVHTPTGSTIFDFGFPTLLSMKAWFTTVGGAI